MAEDDDIVALVRTVGPRGWAELDEIIEQLANEPRPYEWQGGDRTATGVIQMPWVLLDPAADRAIRWLGEQQLVTHLADRTTWYTPHRYPDAPSVDAASLADTVRLATSIVRGDRFSEGTIAAALDNGIFLAILRRLRSQRASREGLAVDDRTDDYDDSSEYSEDGLYRWWYERRWADGPGLCWVGLNPSTGDTTGRPRPTLRKVVARAKAAGLSSVIVVNLFSWRATKPADLKRAARDHDIVGRRTDEVIIEISKQSPITLAAWGSHGILLGRGRAVAKLLDGPLCLGVTASGEPRHPLYVTNDAVLSPYDPAV
ncbi:MAG: DUF1643 domain-containing protein [Acidimicrobiia bacterium]|nr:DUF1643 domain-containing protein [Acidimicrobiia bacterium]